MQAPFASTSYSPSNIFLDGVTSNIQTQIDAKTTLSTVSQRLDARLVYFSAQLNNGATGAAGSVALTGSMWDSSSVVTSHTTINSAANFASQGFVAPRQGVYKIDCYQTIKSTTNNSGNASLFVKRTHGTTTTTIAKTNEQEANTGNASRSESLVWLGNLEVDDVITFFIQCDNGFTLNNSIGLGCFTIMAVDTASDL